MQFILNEEEYKDLTSSANKKIPISKEDLQKLCTDLAIHKPVKFWGREEMGIWGCILIDSSESDKSAPYCDECPAKEFCPSTMKDWSK